MAGKNSQWYNCCELFLFVLKKINKKKRQFPYWAGVRLFHLVLVLVADSLPRAPPPRISRATKTLNSGLATFDFNSIIFFFCLVGRDWAIYF